LTVISVGSKPGQLLPYQEKFQSRTQKLY